MSCCTREQCQGTNTFFSKRSKKFVKDFHKKGFSKSQRQLLEGIQKLEVKDKSILDIGCGAGFLHSELLKQGSAKVVAVDISEGMIAAAKKYASDSGLEKKIDYRIGDFIDMKEEIDQVDITILDKVICCYPEYKELVKSSLEKTRKIYSYTMPLKAWWISPIFRLFIGIFKLFGASFHPYNHDPEEVKKLVMQHGFKPILVATAKFWQTSVYSKS